MRRLLARSAGVFRRRWRVLLILALLAGTAAGLSAPYLRAWHHWYAARRALDRYHAAEARVDLEACLRRWPDSPQVHLLAARAARRDGDLAESRRQLVLCQAGDGGEDAVFEWALLHASGGDLDKVEEYLKGQARRDLGRARLVWEALAEGYLRVHRSVHALLCLGEWLEHDPDNPQALFLRGNLHRQVKAPQKAVPDYRRVVELDPQRHDARRRLAACLLEVGRYEEAVAHLEILRRRQPDDVEVLARLANGRHLMGQTEEARQLLDAVLAEHPDYGPALRIRGEMALASDELSEAEGWLRRAVGAMPSDYKANWDLYECLRRQDKADEADAQKVRTERLKDRLERVSEITTRQLSAHPGDPALQCELGGLYLSLGNADLGEHWLLSALRRDPKYAPAHTALADFYEQRGDPESAAEHRRQAQPAAAP